MGRSSRGSGRGLEAGGLHSPQMHPQADRSEVWKFPHSETKAKEIKPAKTSQIICKAYYNTEFNVSPYVHEIGLPRWSCIICISSQFLSYFSKVSPATGNFWIKALKFSVKRKIYILSQCKWTFFFLNKLVVKSMEPETREFRMKRKMMTVRFLGCQACIQGSSFFQHLCGIGLLYFGNYDMSWRNKK